MQEASDGNIHVIRHGEVFVITLRGEVDHDDAPALQAAWDAADHAMLPTTALDLSQLLFGDSMLLSALLRAKHRHDADGRDLILLGPLQPAVHRLLDVSGTLDYFTIADTGPAPIS
ncbi:STAS domain-containing protein [Streptomyces sp. NPDC056132]|uniref:STAS domain-containing protein n=1 Tax=Streptomyces sp. NPDC056132 TaxID=3345722 RepID=UPI0035DAEB7D